jgi:hypothetical protein
MRGYPCLDSEASVYWHRDSVFVIFPILPGRYRVLADLPPSGADHPPEPTLEQVQAIMDRRFDPEEATECYLRGRGDGLQLPVMMHAWL